MIRVLFLLLFLMAALPAHAGDVPVTGPDAKKEAPLRADAGLVTAEAQLAEGKYVQAVETLGAVLARRPSDADALAYLGFAWMKINDLKKAEEYLDRALKYDPRHLGANLYKADLYLAANDISRALEQLQAIRVICAEAPCAEVDILQAKLNAFKAKPAAP